MNETNILEFRNGKLLCQVHKIQLQLYLYIILINFICLQIFKKIIKILFNLMLQL